jgi:hypothetical protein
VLFSARSLEFGYDFEAVMIRVNIIFNETYCSENSVKPSIAVANHGVQIVLVRLSCILLYFLVAVPLRISGSLCRPTGLVTLFIGEPIPGPEEEHFSNIGTSDPCPF